MRGTWGLFLGILAVRFVGGHILLMYRDVELRTRKELVWDITKLVAFGLVAVNAGLYLFRADYISRAFILTIGGVDFVLLIAGRWASVWSGSWLREKLQRHHHCLIVGSGPAAARELAAVIETTNLWGCA